MMRLEKTLLGIQMLYSHAWSGGIQRDATVVAGLIFDVVEI